MDLKKYSAGWFALALSFIGAAGFYLWQPITDYFISGTFDENVILELTTESFPLNHKNRLLVIHVKIVNRGNVPVTIKNPKDEGELQLEIRRIDQTTNGNFVDPEKQPLITEKHLLDKYTNSYVIAPNAYQDEVESIPLPPGNYWIKATLVFDGGDYVEQVSIVRVGDDTK